MADVFEEVDEALRQEKLENFWKTYRGYILFAIAALILGTAGISGFKSWNSHQNIKQTNLILDALDPDTGSNKEAYLNLAKNADTMRPGLKGISMLVAGAKLVEEGDKQQALSLYQKAASDNSIPDNLRDLGELMRIRLESEISDTTLSAGVIKDLIASLAVIGSKENSPWNYHAKLEAAVLEAHHNQNYHEAGEYLGQILENNNVPPSIITRARSLQHVYQLKAASIDQESATQENTKQTEKVK